MCCSSSSSAATSAFSAYLEFSNFQFHEFSDHHPISCTQVVLFSASWNNSGKTLQSGLCPIHLPVQNDTFLPSPSMNVKLSVKPSYSSILLCSKGLSIK